MDIREKLLEAAARVYAETGFRGATTRRIATEAGVNEVTLFRHFGSKTALLSEAMSRAASARERPALPEEPQDPAAELTQWARAYLADLRRCRALVRTSLAEAELHPEIRSPGNPVPVQTQATLSDYIARLRERGMAAGEYDPAVAATMLMGILFTDGMTRDMLPELFPADPEAAVTDYVRLFLRAIGVAQ